MKPIAVAPFLVLPFSTLIGRNDGSRPALEEETSQLYGGSCNTNQESTCSGTGVCVSTTCWKLGKPTEVGWILGKPDQCSSDGSSDCGTVHFLHTCVGGGN